MRTIPETVFLWGGLVLIALILLASLVLQYFAYFRAGEIMKNLSNSPAVVARSKSLGWDPAGRFLFISCVGTLFIFSKKSLKSGELNTKDYQCFPVGLRRKIEVISVLMLALCVIAIIGMIIGNYNGWIK